MIPRATLDNIMWFITHDPPNQELTAAEERATYFPMALVIRTIFSQPDAKHLHSQFAAVATMLGGSHPTVAAMLDDAQHDLLALGLHRLRQPLRPTARPSARQLATAAHGSGFTNSELSTGCGNYSQDVRPSLQEG